MECFDPRCAAIVVLSRLCKMCGAVAHADQCKSIFFTLRVSPPTSRRVTRVGIYSLTSSRSLSGSRRRA
eukprot:183030-Pyramimonas_sp.AAC.1